MKRHRNLRNAAVKKLADWFYRTSVSKTRPEYNCSSISIFLCDRWRNGGSRRRSGSLWTYLLYTSGDYSETYSSVWWAVDRRTRLFSLDPRAVVYKFVMDRFATGERRDASDLFAMFLFIRPLRRLVVLRRTACSCYCILCVYCSSLADFFYESNIIRQKATTTCWSCIQDEIR